MWYIDFYMVIMTLMINGETRAAPTQNSCLVAIMPGMVSRKWTQAKVHHGHEKPMGHPIPYKYGVQTKSNALMTAQ